MDTLSQLLRREAQASPNGTTLARLLEILGPIGPAALMVTLPLPFCTPLQIPGLSTPFGLLLLVVGVQFGWRDQLWCPEFVGRRLIKAAQLDMLARFTDKATYMLRNVFRPRWTLLVTTKWSHRMTGVGVVACALVMTTPLPIPLSNMLVAIPMVLMGLSLLAKDGILLMVSWGLTLCGLTSLGWLLALAFRELQHAL